MRLRAAVAFVLIVLVLPSLLLAETFSKQQVRCATGLQSAGGHVAKIQVARFLSCASKVARHKLPTGQSARECLVVDPGHRLARAEAKTIKVGKKFCGSAPPFGPHDARLVNEGLAAALRTSGVFGSQLETSFIDAKVDAPGARCQKVAAHGMARLTERRLTTFRACLTDVLRSRTAPVAAGMAERAVSRSASSSMSPTPCS